MTTTFTIDCQTCPARGRMCGDCFVPVLARTWMEPPTVRGEGPPGTAVQTDPGAVEQPDGTVPLDTDELAAVSAFVRAGLVDPAQASRARAQVSAQVRTAAG